MNTKQYNGIRAGVLTVCTGMLLAGCASSKYNEGAYVENESAGANTQQMSAQDAWVIPLHEEKLNVGKQNVDAGQVTIRKTVTSKTVSEPVELRKEAISIEREPAGAQTSSDAAFGQPFEAKSVTIGLREERPVIQKTTVTSGRVVAKKHIEMNKENVQGEVRSEDVQVDKGGTP